MVGKREVLSGSDMKSRPVSASGFIHENKVILRYRRFDLLAIG